MNEAPGVALIEAAVIGPADAVRGGRIAQEDPGDTVIIRVVLHGACVGGAVEEGQRAAIVALVAVDQAASDYRALLRIDPAAVAGHGVVAQFAPLHQSAVAIDGAEESIGVFHHALADGAGLGVDARAPSAGIAAAGDDAVADGAAVEVGPAVAAAEGEARQPRPRRHVGAADRAGRPFDGGGSGPVEAADLDGLIDHQPVVAPFGQALAGLVEPVGNQHGVPRHGRVHRGLDAGGGGGPAGKGELVGSARADVVGREVGGGDLHPVVADHAGRVAPVDLQAGRHPVPEPDRRGLPPGPGARKTLLQPPGCVAEHQGPGHVEIVRPHQSITADIRCNDLHLIRDGDNDWIYNGDLVAAYVYSLVQNPIGARPIQRRVHPQLVFSPVGAR